MIEESRDAAKERRLEALRQEAEATGRVTAPGIRPEGAPFPAPHPAPAPSASTGYYGLPLVKHPPWIWTVPVYFFVGGAAGAAAMIAAVGHWTRGTTPLVRDARRIAALGAVLSPALLIADLGRPARFLHMLRVVKPQSPMSVGSWTLVAFSAAEHGSLLMRLVAHRASGSRRLESAARAAADIAETAGAAVGGVLATYTGVLIGVSAIPVWANNIRLLPFHFGMSAVASATTLLELRHDDAALHRLATGAAIAETAVGAIIELDRARAQRPLTHGPSGRLVRLGGILSGPAALAIRLAFGRRRAGRHAAALVSLAGSVITRFAWLEAGRRSSEDPHDVVGLPDEATPPVLPDAAAPALPGRFAPA